MYVGTESGLSVDEKYDVTLKEYDLGPLWTDISRQTLES